MGVTPLEKLVSFLDQNLKIAAIPDSSVNGVQIQGADRVSHVAVSVDAGLSVVEAAVDCGAEFLLVHHGLYWGGSLPVVGPTQKLMKTALGAGLTLYAAHLPLDAHENWGNNFCLARMLGLAGLRSAIPHNGTNIGCVGLNKNRRSLAELEKILAKLPGARLPLLSLPFGPEIPESVCIVTGSGSDALWKWSDEGFDTLITGEPRQAVYHYAKEHKRNVLFGGHYATETIGVCEVAKALEKEFGLSWTFLDQPTGI